MGPSSHKRRWVSFHTDRRLDGSQFTQETVGPTSHSAGDWVRQTEQKTGWVPFHNEQDTGWGRGRVDAWRREEAYRLHKGVLHRKNAIRLHSTRVNERWGADKSLARPGRKQATATKLGIYSTYFPRSSIHFLALALTFATHSKKIQKVVRPTRSLRQQ